MPPTDHNYPAHGGADNGRVPASRSPRHPRRRTVESDAPCGRADSGHPEGGAPLRSRGDGRPTRMNSVAQLRDSSRIVTIDYLGEDTTKVEDADATVRAYLDLLDALGKRGEAANAAVRPLEVSLKLSALGQALPRDGEKIALENAHTICERAQRHRRMGDGRRRGSHHHRLDAVDRARASHRIRLARNSSAGVPETHPSRLRGVRRVRCPDPAVQGRIRRAGVGRLPRPDDVTDSYLRCLGVLMAGSGYPMVASHDPAIIDAVPALVRETGRSVRRFRVPDALRHPRRRAATAGRRRQPNAGLRSVRQRSGTATSCAGWPNGPPT